MHDSGMSKWHWTECVWLLACRYNAVRFTYTFVTSIVLGLAFWQVGQDRCPQTLPTLPSPEGVLAHARIAPHVLGHACKRLPKPPSSHAWATVARLGFKPVLSRY